MTDTKRIRKETRKYAERKDYLTNWRKENKEAQKQWWSEYRQKNKKRIRANNKAYHERHKNKPEFKLVKNLRERLRSALKGFNKSGNTMLLVGCSIKELKAHLEKQFKPNMTWNNYGQWHIDHIKPCSKFNLLDPAAQLQCFHFTNLQPLWAVENLSKGNR